jgi:cell division protein DivIC
MRGVMRKDSKKRAAGIVILLFSAALIGALALGKRGFIAQIRIRQENRRLREAGRVLEAEKERLEAEKEKMNDPEYLEKVAREEHNMARKNEKVLRVVPREKR